MEPQHGLRMDLSPLRAVLNEAGLLGNSKFPGEIGAKRKKSSRSLLPTSSRGAGLGRSPVG